MLMACHIIMVYIVNTPELPQSHTKLFAVLLYWKTDVISATASWIVMNHCDIAGIILCMRPANERRYVVT